MDQHLLYDAIDQPSPPRMQDAELTVFDKGNRCTISGLDPQKQVGIAGINAVGIFQMIPRPEHLNGMRTVGLPGKDHPNGILPRGYGLYQLQYRGKV